MALLRAFFTSKEENRSKTTAKKEENETCADSLEVMSLSQATTRCAKEFHSFDTHKKKNAIEVPNVWTHNLLAVCSSVNQQEGAVRFSLVR